MNADSQAVQVTCKKCGNCCRVRGYVRLREGEIDTIAGYLGLSITDFTKSYTRVTHDRRGLSLIERSDASCIFLADDSLCAINAVKPAQCRDFPHLWHFAGYRELCETEKDTENQRRLGQKIKAKD